MKKVILSLATSLDGYIEGPNGEIDWMTFSEETGKALGEFLEEIDTIVYGRVSYEKWGNYSPLEEASPFEKQFYNTTSKMQKCVFSNSKIDFEGNPIISSCIPDTINKLKREKGKNIWLYGGGNLITSFANLNLIDEFRIAVMPIILGAGKPLFAEIQNRIKLQLLKAESSESGIIELNYKKLSK